MSWWTTRFNGRCTGPLRLYMFRHGQSEANVNPGVISGRQESCNLTDLGEKQSTALGEWLHDEDIKLDLYYCSSAVRTKQTAINALRECDWYNPEKLVVSDELLEIDMGSWVGNNREDTYSPDNVKLIQEDPWRFAPENGESQKDVEERISSYMEDTILKQADAIRSNPQEEISVGIFGHCLATACFLRNVISSDPYYTWKIRIDNSAITEFRFTMEDGWFVEKVNGTPHYPFIKD